MINIDQQWDELIGYVDTYISSPRREKLKKLYETLSERICTAPASSATDRHNCFPGGYIDHVNRVVQNTIAMYKFWESIGMKPEFTLESAVFSALNHDLGKIGDKKEEYYIINDSEWHAKRGQVYKINPKLNFMKVPDRSIFTLQEAGIEINEEEFLAIKLHDGLYSKGNESYLMPGLSDFSLKTTLPILIHHADHISSLIESRHNHKTEAKESKGNRNKFDDLNIADAINSIFTTT